MGAFFHYFNYCPGLGCCGRLTTSCFLQGNRPNCKIGITYSVNAILYGIVDLLMEVMLVWANERKSVPSGDIKNRKNHDTPFMV
jgi:hypothetical protein